MIIDFELLALISIEFGFKERNVLYIIFFFRLMAFSIYVVVVCPIASKYVRLEDDEDNK